MARTQRSIEERISEKEMQYEGNGKGETVSGADEAAQTAAKSRGTQETYPSAVSDWRNRGKGTGSSAGGGRCDASFKFPKSAGTKWKIFYQSNGKVPGYGQ